VSASKPRGYAGDGALLVELAPLEIRTFEITVASSQRRR
jgi:hypothetical protein